MPLFQNVSIKVKPRRKIDTSFEKDDYEEPQPINYSVLYKMYEQCPELVGVINALVTDIIGPGWTLVGDKDKVDQMNKLLTRIEFRKKLKNFLIHGFIAGDAYLEYQELPEEKTKALIRVAYKSITHKFRVEKSLRNRINFKKDYIEKAVTATFKEIKTNIIFPFNLTNIKSSTMEIKVDNKGNPKSYIQKAMPNTEDAIDFKLNEIIRWGPFNLGNVYNFSPTHSLLNDVATLLYAKEYAGKFFENGGVPDNIFILPKSRGLEDRNYQVLKKELREHREKKNFHKSMVFTGEVDIKKLNDFNKDLEFPELLKQMTMRILMAFNMPPTKTPFGGATKAASREMDENYWKLVDFWQRELEDLFNLSIFEPRSLTWKLSKPYKIDELREAQIIGILVDRNILTKKEQRERIGYFGEVPKELLLTEEMPRRDLPQRDLGDTQDSRGLGTDVGARLADTFPDLSKSESIKYVGFSDFRKIVEARGPFQNQKVFYRDNGDTYTLFYSDSLFIYQAEVDKTTFDEALLTGAIKVR